MLGATGTTDVGPLCTNDFKINPRTAVVCGEVARFASPTYLAELFRGMPIDRMFRSIEANVAWVSSDMRAPLYFLGFLFPLRYVLLLYSFFPNDLPCADPDAVPHARGGFQHGYAEIQERVDSKHARNESLIAERSTLAERARGLEARVAELEGERRVLPEEVQTL